MVEVAKTDRTEQPTSSAGEAAPATPLAFVGMVATVAALGWLVLPKQRPDEVPQAIGEKTALPHSQGIPWLVAPHLPPDWFHSSDISAIRLSEDKSIAEGSYTWGLDAEAHEAILNLHELKKEGTYRIAVRDVDGRHLNLQWAAQDSFGILFIAPQPPSTPETETPARQKFSTFATVGVEYYDADLQDRIAELAYQAARDRGMNALPKPVVGEQYPQWSLTTADGDDISFNDFKGTTLLIENGATFCGPCMQLSGPLQSLLDSHSGKLTVISVTLDPSSRNQIAANYMAEHSGIKGWHNVRIPSDSEAGQMYARALSGGNLGLPFTIIIDGEGKVVFADNANADTLIRFTEAAVRRLESPGGGNGPSAKSQP